MLTPLPALLVGRPFTTAEAITAGLTPRMLQHPRFRAITTGVWTTHPQPPLAVRVAGALQVLPALTFATGVTGLRLHGVDVGNDAPLHFVTVGPDRVRRTGLTVHRARSAPPNDGFVVAPAHCFVDATDLGLVKLVTAGDWLVLLGKVSPDDLRAAVTPGRRGARLARRAAALVRRRVESPKESELRLVLVLAGLPEPSCNLDVGDATRWLARGDLVFEKYGVIVEYDGLQHLSDRAQWESDVVRLETLARAGWVVIRVTARRLRRPEQLVLDVADALNRGGWTGTPTLTPEWRATFANGR